MLRLLKIFFGEKKHPLQMVTGFTNQGIAAKLLAIGVVPGSQLQIIRKAPGGFVFYLKIDGVSIALRKNELNAIVLKPITS